MPKANPRGNPKPVDRRENLKPLNKRTLEEIKEITSKGGIASGESRRARKTLREELLALLSINNYQEKITLALLEKAVKTGDTRAFEVIRDTIGEKPKEELGITMQNAIIKIGEQSKDNGNTH